jgi:hypothetical protein
MLSLLHVVIADATKHLNPVAVFASPRPSHSALIVQARGRRMGFATEAN